MYFWQYTHIHTYPHQIYCECIAGKKTQNGSPTLFFPFYGMKLHYMLRSECVSVCLSASLWGWSWGGLREASLLITSWSPAFYWHKSKEIKEACQEVRKEIATNAHPLPSAPHHATSHHPSHFYIFPTLFHPTTDSCTLSIIASACSSVCCHVLEF